MPGKEDQNLPTHRGMKNGVFERNMKFLPKYWRAKFVWEEGRKFHHIHDKILQNLHESKLITRP